MAIRFSPNACVRHALQEYVRRNEYNRFTPEEITKLTTLLNELEGLAVSDEVINPEQELIGPNVALPVHMLCLERSMDPKRTAAIYLELHNLIKKEWVPLDFYWYMTEAFEELNIPLDDQYKELAVAVLAARRCRPYYTEGIFPVRAEITRLTNGQEPRGGDLRLR